MSETILRPESLEELPEAVTSVEHVRAFGGRTKTALVVPGASELDLSKLSGIVEYDPGEYTILALAGTRVAEIAELLRAKGQYLPFDPPFVESGATIGGTVVTGLSGSGRFRYGGVRDFLIGIRFVDGEGNVLRGGGRVVKNAAGFDFPKLFVGSLGRFGVLAEVTFKVFPEPAAWRTIEIEASDHGATFDLVAELASSKLELSALDVDDRARVFARLGGVESALVERVDSVRALVGGRAGVREVEEEARIWHDAREFAWVPEGSTLVKVPTTIRATAAVVESLSGRDDLVYRSSAGASVLWVAWPSARSIDELRGLIDEHELAGLALRSDSRIDPPIFGPVFPVDFWRRVVAVLDPRGRFRGRES